MAEAEVAGTAVDPTLERLADCLARDGCRDALAAADDELEARFRAGESVVALVRLRAAFVDTVLIGGLLTHVCCDTSARDAAMLGFRTVLIGDAMATDGPEWHQATLETFHRSFGDVRTVASAVATLTGERVAEDAAE